MNTVVKAKGGKRAARPEKAGTGGRTRNPVLKEFQNAQRGVCVVVLLRK